MRTRIIYMLRLPAALLLGFAAVTSANIANAATAQRKSIMDLTAQEVASLRHGVQQMMYWSKDPKGSDNYRRSWAYWANMHAHFGDDCEGPVTRAGMGGVLAIIATSDDEKATWCTCEHGTYGFLTWHRMHLYYFEKVIATAARDPALRLPYWDYEHDTKLPPAFREETYLDNGVTKKNPLYVVARNARLNAGTAGLDPNTTSSKSAFSLADYWGGGVGFNGVLERAPHGAVHCALGVAGCRTGLMGAVPAAALDPIFYLHHTNIDRLNECWLSADSAHRLPSDQARLDDSYSFPDEKGRIVKRRVCDMLEAGALGYGYTKPARCPQSARPRAGGFQSILQRSELVIGGPAAIGTGGASEQLEVSPALRSAFRTSRSQAGAPSTRALAVGGITYDRPPASLYKVYLVRGRARAQIGTINFFSGRHARGAHANPAASGFDAVFPLTDVPATLRLEDAHPGQTRLEFEPATGLAGDSPDDAARLNNPADNLRYASVKLITTKP